MEDEVAESEGNSSSCDNGKMTECDSNTENEIEENVDALELMEDEEVIEEPVVASTQKVSLKDGKTCRLKTEGEKLSKIIRKTGKAKQREQIVMEEEVEKVAPVVKKNSKVKTTGGKVKRDTFKQETVGKADKKVNKKNSKSKESQKKVKGKQQKGSKNSKSSKGSKGQKQKTSKKGKKYINEL